MFVHEAGVTAHADGRRRGRHDNGTVMSGRHNDGLYVYIVMEVEESRRRVFVLLRTVGGVERCVEYKPKRCCCNWRSSLQAVSTKSK